MVFPVVIGLVVLVVVEGTGCIHRRSAFSAISARVER